MTKFIFVAGGVMSGIGKGVAVASIARILKSRGFRVTAVKIDPYINVGNYERFLGENIYADNYLTTGQVYRAVIERERNLEYQGRCVEVVPDIPEEVISRLKKAAKKNKADFILTEIGGTVGEYQNMLFLEAARMLKLNRAKDVLFVLVSYLPIPKMIGEMKTKPTQYAVRTLNSAGIQPDIILARSALPLDEVRKKKISIFCNVSAKDVISAPDIETIYEIPLNFEKENLGARILKKLEIRQKPKKDLRDWRKLVRTIKNSRKKVKIGIVGKYFKTGKFTLTDSYISVLEAIKHAAYFFGRKPEIFWLSAEDYDKNPQRLKELKEYDGIIVPGGFGIRGIEGKIKTIEFCRKNKIPFLGLCLGMQLAVIEFARNVSGLKKAGSTEFEKKCLEPLIDVMPEQKVLLKEKKYGGTMRLGAYRCKIKPGTISSRAYQSNLVSERHRHRYELNNQYRAILEERGLVMAGVNPEKNLVEIIEVKNHPFFLAVQFHPEFKSRPLRPHPLFREFIRASTKSRKRN
jgi:CTP synthase